MVYIICNRKDFINLAQSLFIASSIRKCGLLGRRPKEYPRFRKLHLELCVSLLKVVHTQKHDFAISRKKPVRRIL